MFGEYLVIAALANGSYGDLLNIKGEYGKGSYTNLLNRIENSFGYDLLNRKREYGKGSYTNLLNRIENSFGYSAVRRYEISVVMPTVSCVQMLEGKNQFYVCFL
ncbi:hypothetical protein TorRG33x02_290750 [Trema orientale]|uniref:Uncharacterized protein n=1 Tax=Trema orientale TaxID=63057 RepID=A0A2P5CC03_TREOI|nr:hypothetical protein TorRG33x02_290750 [Trema orientale]